MPPQESDRGFKCSYLVIRLAVFLEWLRLTVWSYVETVRKALGIDTTSNRAINPNNNSRKNDSYLAEKRKLIERCLCLQPKNPENVMPLEIITGKETTNKERKLSSSIDLWELRELALSDGGLLSAQYRQKAWPRLVGLTEEQVPELADTLDDEVNIGLCVGGVGADQLSTRSMSINHGSASSLGVMDEEQLLDEEKKSENIDASVDMIRRDVGRSVVFRYNLAGHDGSKGEENISDDGTQSGATNYTVTPKYAGQMLAKVLEDTIRGGNSPLHYYQGLHDIGGVILHNMNYQTGPTTHILKRISHSHLRDALRENFGNITWVLSVVLPPLVEKVESHVHDTLLMAQVDLSNIVLPWMITWFTHDLHDAETAGRLVDAFLAGHPLMPLYFAVALITHPISKQELFQADCEDQGTIFLILKKLPLALGKKEPIDIPSISLQEVLDDSIAIMNRFPPRTLLDLVDSELFPRPEILHRASSICLFKAPASWSMASGSMTPFMTGMDGVDSRVCTHIRARVASGVPILMAPVSRSSILSNSSWGSRINNPKKVKKLSTKLKRLVRVRLGMNKIKAS